MARYFTLRLYFHSPIVHENNISLFVAGEPGEEEVKLLLEV